MPSIGGTVYQPTTYNVGYEQSQWPRRSRVSKFADWLQSESCCQRLFLSCCGIVCLFVVFFLYQAVTNVVDGVSIFEAGSAATVAWYILFTAMGFAIIVFAGMLYFRLVRNQRFYFWPFLRKENLGRQMSTQSRNGQMMVTNPSTDLLVTPAEYYAPTVMPPPTLHEEDERRNLMGNESKEIHDEGEDKHLESDPRIILTPSNRLEEA